MLFTTTLWDLLKGGPKNIKKRLLRDILIILFITIGAILTLVLLQGVKTQQDISTTIIQDANRLVSKRFQAFTNPFSTIIQLLAKWGESGLLKLEEPTLLATQFQALLEIEPNISSISLAGTAGHEVRLVHRNDQWLLSEFSQEKQTHSLWLHGKSVQTNATDNTSYNPLQTPWFRGALTAPAQNSFFYTGAYILPGKDETGVTISTRWTRGDNSETIFVSAISFTLQNLLTFMEQLKITPNSQILLLQKNGTLLSNLLYNNNLPSSAEKERQQKVSRQMLTLVSKRLKNASLEKNQVSAIKEQGKVWWLGLSPLHDANQDVWVAVLIPENDVFTDLKKQWLRFALISGSILFGAILMTIILVRRYSHQLKDLPQQHIDSQSYEHEIAGLIRAGESTTLEFKSSMRTNLATGKPGKEIELAWLKTVVGFMNSDGGILLIGVEDDGTLLGIEVDKFASEDKCRLHFKNLINTHIGAEFTRFIHLKIVVIQEKTILIIECERVRKPVFLTVGKNEDFFIRSGPSSTKLTMSQLVKYLAER